MRYRQKVFDMVKGIDVEFGKKKKEEDGTMTRKKRKRDKMEEPPVMPVPFKKQSCFFKYLWHFLTHTEIIHKRTELPSQHFTRKYLGYRISMRNGCVTAS
jgi:hypothetical protein